MASGQKRQGSNRQIRGPATLDEEYGSFSVIIRALGDTDSNQQVLERYDNLNLDPTSPNFISKRIGDVYYDWDEGNQRLRKYGDYENNPSTSTLNLMTKLKLVQLIQHLCHSDSTYRPSTQLLKLQVR